jgi:hypothetical protein
MHGVETSVWGPHSDLGNQKDILERKKQCFGSVIIESGSGSSILGWIPSGSRVLMTKNWKKFTAAKKNLIFF